MILLLLRRYLRRYARELGIVILLQLIGTTASLYLPNLNARIIDEGVARGDTGFIVRTGLVMLVAAALQIATSMGAVYAGARAAMGFGADLRAATFRHVGTLSAREVGSLGAPSLITRVTNDVQQIQVLVLMGCTMLVTAPIMCVGGIVMALRDDLTLSRLLLVAVPVLAGSIGVIVARMVPLYRALQPKLDTVNRIVREQIRGVRVVRAFVREPAEAARFDRANTDLTATAIRVGNLQALMFPVVTIVFNVSMVAVLWYGSRRVASGALPIGAMTAFLSYLMQILISVMMATFITVMIPRASVCAERIVEVLDTPSSVMPPAVPVAATAAAGLVELEDVELRYPGAAAPVVSRVSFTARPGQITALIGSTGAGKTTVLQLVPRLLDATGGTVRVGGVDVRERDLDGLWSSIGMVPQKAFLFSGTVASNLRYGKPDATDDELWAALRLAQAADFVEAMPERLEAPIAQGGTNVSGGQRQRLSIARALVRRPAIYLFDDAFSALDLATEARLRAGLVEQMGDATVILVAQRIASIRDAHQIVVLDEGGVAGVGTHAELLATCPPYQEIEASQRGATAEAAA